MAGAVRVDCAVVLESTLVSLVPVSLVVVDAASLVPQSSLCRWLRLAGNLPIEWRVRVPAYITWTLREKERERERVQRLDETESATREYRRSPPRSLRFRLHPLLLLAGADAATVEVLHHSLFAICNDGGGSGALVVLDH